jgi:hypothetical protein
VRISARSSNAGSIRIGLAINGINPPALLQARIDFDLISNAALKRNT